MIVKGVGRNGEDVKVADDFSAHIPYGWCYDIDEYASNGEPVFTFFHPASRPSGYAKGNFDLDDDTSCEVIFKFKQIGTVTVAEDAMEMDVDIENILEQSSNNTKNISVTVALGAMFGSEIDDEDEDKDGFRRVYKVVKNDPFLKVGYFTSGFLGKTVYNVLLYTSHHIYLSASVSFLEDDYNENERIIERTQTSHTHHKPKTMKSSRNTAYYQSKVQIVPKEWIRYSGKREQKLVQRAESCSSVK